MCRVSVVISAYNTEKYIKSAMESILSQTYKDLELIVINDGSSDNTAEEIRSVQDSRVVFVDNKKNYGLLYELNYGISIARGEYIARLDSDDIAYPNRIEKQVKYLDEHKEVVLVGNLSDSIIGEKVKAQRKLPVITSRQIKFSLAFGNYAFAHSSFMIRKEILEKNNIQYETYLYSQDYHLMAQMSMYGDVVRLQEVLTGYRVHPEQATQVRGERMRTDEIDNARIEFLESLSLSDKDKKSLKYGILRKLDSKQKVIDFLNAFNEYARVCNLTNSEEDNACKKFIFSEMMIRQRRTVKFLRICMDKRVRPLLDERFGIIYIIKCLVHCNYSYVSTSLEI